MQCTCHRLPHLPLSSQQLYSCCTVSTCTLLVTGPFCTFYSMVPSSFYHQKCLECKMNKSLKNSYFWQASEPFWLHRCYMLLLHFNFHRYICGTPFPPPTPTLSITLLKVPCISNDRDLCKMYDLCIQYLLGLIYPVYLSIYTVFWQHKNAVENGQIDIQVQRFIAVFLCRNTP